MQDGTHIVIEPHTGWRGINWRELYQYRDLFVFMTWRNVKVRYAQSAIGVGWAVAQPLMSMLVYTVIFGMLIGVETDGTTPYALYTFTALVPWTYFANTLSQSATSMVANAHIISKIYFPRLILPFSVIAAKMVDFGIALVVLAVLMAVYQTTPSADIVYLPLLILIMTSTATGLGLWLTAMAIQYRDVAYALQFAVQLLMYAAPVVYPASLVPVDYQLLYALNPMVGVIEGFRSALLDSRSMPWDFIGIGMVVSTLTLLFGTAYFRRKEHVFADVA
jgi:lipopolysaccharide transport system permease protein